MTSLPVHLPPPALEEAAVRFRELQAEKELRQLQEDRKNDRKPPPYKHIKVREKTCSIDLFVQSEMLHHAGFLKRETVVCVPDFDVKL